MKFTAENLRFMGVQCNFEDNLVHGNFISIMNCGYPTPITVEIRDDNGNTVYCEVFDTTYWDKLEVGDPASLDIDSIFHIELGCSMNGELIPKN